MAVVRVDDVVEDQPRGRRHRRRPAEPDGLGRVVVRDARAEVVVGEDRVDDAAAGVGHERLDVRRQVEAGRLALLGRDVADVDADAPAAAAIASRISGSSRLGSRLV